MRNLFLLLVLLNLGFAAVTRWVVPEPRVSRYAGPGITLLRELDRGAARPAAPEATGSVRDRAPGADTDPEAERCVAIGPFVEPTDADAAMAKLVEAGFEPSVLDREGEVWDGYRVSIERIGSLQAARQLLSALSGEGAEDAHLVSSSASDVSISLGVYADISRAGAQAERVARLGYKATIADSHRTAPTQWLEITLRGDASAAFDLLRSPGQISRLEQHACQSPAVEAE